MPPYSPAAIANVFLDLAEQEGKSLSNMKIQKLVYFAHGWHLAVSQGPLSNELPMAWQYGPVFWSLYQDLKIWGGVAIQERIRTAEAVDNEAAQRIIGSIWETCKNLSAFQLAQRSHMRGSPWHTIRVETHGALFETIRTT